MDGAPAGAVFVVRENANVGRLRLLHVEPFARGEQSRNRATGGAGLGLSIAREIAEGEGGTLVLASRAGGGLDAVIALPVQA